MSIDLTAFKQGIELIGTTMGLFKQIKDLLPNDPKKIAVEKALEDAERTLKIAEATIAQSFGYLLCQCAFPPQIMLLQSSNIKAEKLYCPQCQRGHTRFLRMK